MFRKNKIYLIIAIILSIGISRFCVANDNSIKTEDNQFNEYVELRKIVDTVDLVQEHWVGEKKIDSKSLYEGALSGLMNSLDDPYSEYYTQEEYKEQQEDIDGTYTGVGMSIQKKKGEYLEVVSPFIGSPAYKANIQIGDKITKIGNEDIIDWTALECSKKLKGPKGTAIEVEIIRKGVKNPFKVTLIRDEIKLENVEFKMIDNEIGYISLLKFGTGISPEIEDAVIKLKQKGMKKLILDLRTNPGGSLIEAVDLGSLFTSEKLMVSLVDKKGKKNPYYRTRSQVFDGQMVVLINKGSASASEILSGILKDYNRATLIGEKSYGKGVAQSIIPFQTGDAIKITTAKFETPKNNHIHKEGIEPHIYIQMESILALKGYANETKKALDNRKKEIKKILEEIHGKNKAANIISKGDIQLKAAIDYLQGKKVESNKKEEKK